MILGDIPTVLLLLPALSLAAGLDLYLTLILLGVSPHIGLWEQPLPGALGDLDSLGVHLVAGGFYLMEVVAERRAPTAMVWNAFHAVIRPLAGALLALLLLDGQPTVVVLGGALVAALLASLVHSVRTGERLLLWLRSAREPRQGLLSAAEDVVVVALVVTSLDSPSLAAGAAGVLLVAALFRSPSDIRAFLFSIGLGIERLSSLSPSRWKTAEHLPGWLRMELQADAERYPAAGVRGLPAAGLGLPGAPRFTTGWLIIHGPGPMFVFRTLRRPSRVELRGCDDAAAVEHTLFRRVDFSRDGNPCGSLCLGAGAPGAEALEAQLNRA